MRAYARPWKEIKDKRHTSHNNGVPARARQVKVGLIEEVIIHEAGFERLFMMGRATSVRLSPVRPAWES